MEGGIMASSCDRLGQAANVMQVTGVDAFGLVSMIVQAAYTARRNRDLCQQLAQHVQIVGDLLRKLQIPGLRRHPETRRPLEQLDDALFRAYKLVRSCSQSQENSSQLYQMFTGADVASKLRAAQEEIDRYIHLIPMITLVAAVGARGTEEVQEDVTNDPALAQRPRLSLQEVTESLALEELPPTGLPVNPEARRNDWHLMIENVRNGLVGWRDRYLTYGDHTTYHTHASESLHSTPKPPPPDSFDPAADDARDAEGGLQAGLEGGGDGLVGPLEVARHEEGADCGADLEDELVVGGDAEAEALGDEAEGLAGGEAPDADGDALADGDGGAEPGVLLGDGGGQRVADHVESGPAHSEGVAEVGTQLTSSNVGFRLLQKMGWKGKGLGKNEHGFRLLQKMRWKGKGLGKNEQVKGLFQEAHEDADVFKEFENGTGPRRFSYKKLWKATHGFSDKQKLGEGGFGAVYRGFFQDQGLHVAIKRVSYTSRQGRREYMAEVTIISRLRHRNLVQLVGWCHEADELLLVYELLTNGSLDTHLHNSGNVLTWPIRYKIILGMGSALLYLHQECEQIVVHRDIKPGNVMLDSSFNVKLGDFGLARLIDHSDAAISTAVAGTLGYLDPQFMFTCRASAGCDVYSFGVVLLEIACGRRPIVHQEDESKVYLVHWVWGMYERGSLLDAVDARLNGEFEAREMERALVVGLWCVHPDYSFRPSIWQAMNVLHQFEAPLPDLPRVMPVPIYPAGGYRSSYTSLPSTTTATSVSTSTPYPNPNFESTDSS